jgi:hypothetical protein
MLGELTCSHPLVNFQYVACYLAGPDRASHCQAQCLQTKFQESVLGLLESFLSSAPFPMFEKGALNKVKGSGEVVLRTFDKHVFNVETSA